MNGGLIAVHRGVYRVGHAAPSVLASYMAAVLACGPGSLLAGRAAAHLYLLIKGPPPRPEVLSPTQRNVDGVLCRRGRRSRLDGTHHRRIPITTVPRTLVDLAADLAESGLARAVHEATVKYTLAPMAVTAVLARMRNAPGSAKLRRVLHGDIQVTMSTLERRFLSRLAAAGLPAPKTNRPAGARYVDCRWPEHRLTVELDSYRYHRSRHAWELDRQREREAYARGDDFRRYTYGDVCEHPRLMLAELRALLRA